MSAHTKLSPSAAHRWMRCPGSIVLERDYPDVSSPYADEGTAAHSLASMVLEQEYPSADAFIGKRMDVSEHKTVEITEEMARHVDDYVAYVREIASGGTLLVEQRVSFGTHLGVDDAIAAGTADAIVVKGNSMHVIDLKYGRGRSVEVEANEQLQMYALGALTLVQELADIDEVTLVIHQPRSGGVKTTTLSTADLLSWAQYANECAASVLQAETANDLTRYLKPGPKACQWCKAKATCPALGQRIGDTVAIDFDDLTEAPKPGLYGNEWLSVAMKSVDLVEDWCKAVRAETERRLLAGVEVPDWKLVEGRKGLRRWSDERTVATLLEAAIPNEAYEKKLISPAAAEKLLKKLPVWSSISASITQSPGAPSVAPVTDKRPAWSPTADMFEEEAK